MRIVLFAAGVTSGINTRPAIMPAHGTAQIATKVATPAITANGANQPASTAVSPSVCPHAVTSTDAAVPQTASRTSTIPTRAITTPCGPSGVVRETASARLGDNAIVTVSASPSSISAENPATAADAPLLTPRNRAASTAIVTATSTTGSTSHGTT